MVMRTRRWQRLTARTVLVVFTVASVACGGSSNEAPVTTTVTAAVEATTSAPPPTEPPPTEPPPTQPAPSPTLPSQVPEQLGKEQLRDLVAPVALYPDVILASLLPATTNPDQVHDAALYVGQAERVDKIPDDRGWDGSVLGLLQFPDVLRWLDENPAWTDEMGQAVTYQQGDVLDAVQDYRRAVQDAGNLKSNQYQRVRAAPDRTVYIEPARPDVVYVPSYDPVIATQPQPAPSPGINPWIVFGAGAAVGALGAWALYSIFDDDHHHHDHYYGRRRIRCYDNYYYARGRRPRPVDWAPRQRPYRRVQGWQQPRRLQHRAVSTQGRPKGVPLRPPRNRPAQPGPARREQRQERKIEHRDQKEQRQGQRQEHRQQKQGQRQQKQEQRQPQRQQRKEQRQEHRREQNQQRQGQGQERRENRQQQKEQRHEQRQEQQEQRQQKQTERREIRQDTRQKNQAQRQEQKKKKKQQAQ
jgi:hypothetical protein